MTQKPREDGARQLLHPAQELQNLELKLKREVNPPDRDHRGVLEVLAGQNPARLLVFLRKEGQVSLDPEVPEEGLSHRVKQLIGNPCLNAYFN